MTICTNCHRTLRNPVLVNGIAYGRICASRVTQKRDPLEPDLLTGIDIPGAAIAATERVNAGIECSAVREVAAMRATWRARA